ncbi:MAG: NADH:ubiquinone reductase (Na(+)-transporting) subunit B [Microscillaceae bacterium]|nr:NADH:ubiquinone reductase (Na(+)-transporting) subunit B [Microscillaceae bacterium]
MKFLRKILDAQKPNFEKGGKLERFHPIFEALETFAFAPNHTAPKNGAQIRDAIDLKRLMMTVVIAMIPCLLFGIWNVGEQHFLATQQTATFMEKIMVGLWITLPLILISYTVGGLVELFFAVRKGHAVNEGFLVTGMLIPLIMPPTIPWWQIAVATAFAIVVGKEVFGGTGMNILNVAMTARAFLYFAYPVNMAGGSDVWVYTAGQKINTDAYSGATALSIAADPNVKDAVASFGDFFSFQNLFIGNIPGSIGETSTLMVLIGAIILIVTGVGSWKIIVSGFLGAYLMGLLFNILPNDNNAFMALPAHYHLVMGGLAFGIVFMATDPVSASQTEFGKWIYGFLIGALTVLIRVFNPAYPEGIMLAVLLMNVFAPLIDYFVVEANKQRRLKRLKLKAA